MTRPNGHGIWRGEWRPAIALIAVIASGSCTPVAPTPPAPGPLAIACPGPMNVPSPNGGPAEVIYTKPRVTGGVQPIETSCTPTVGASFGVGTTTVSCTTVDEARQTASCSFDVTVVVPTISATSYVAFGDSITEGTNGQCVRRFTGDPSTWWFQDVQSLRMNLNPPLETYPGILQSLLEIRYRKQSFTVVNAGRGGETVTDPDTFPRFEAVLDTHDPEVLLLQEGVNDVHGRRSPTTIANRLASMVREAKGRGIPVFLGTLLPERDGSCRAFAPERIVPANVEIRAMAAREGAILVDLYQAFLGQEAILLGQDGLHPTVAGYRTIAETFFERLRAHLEDP